MKKLLIFIITALFLVSVVSATTTCSITQVTRETEEGTIADPSSVFSCTNNDVNDSVTVYQSGDFFTLSDSTPFTIGPSSSRGSLSVSFLDKPAGSYVGLIYFSDGSPAISIVLDITEEETTSGCRLIELPHTTTYSIKQGELGTSREIRVKVSTECEGPLSMSVTQETQMSKPMFLEGSSGDVYPGEEFSFTIGLDARGVSTNTYQNKYTVVGVSGDDIYQKQITLFAVVTAGDTPLTNETFTTMPSCTLPSEMDLESTYSLTCTNENPNIDIEVPYNPSFEGVSVSESNGQFTYKLKPTRIGIAEFTALFKYRGASIGEPFTKEVRVKQGNAPLSGTDLEIVFYQEGVKKTIDLLTEGSVKILVKDNETKSPLSNSDFVAYLNGEIINDTFSLEKDVEYELIVHSIGYVSSLLEFNASNNPIEIKIIPEKDYYRVGELVNVNSTVEGVSYLLDDVIITFPYTFLSEGNKTLKAVKQGYATQLKNVTILKSISYSTADPPLEDWKDGSDVRVELTESSGWEVYRGTELIKMGTGTIVEFEIDGEGIWDLKVSGKSVITKNIEAGWKWWNPLTWGWLGIVIGLVVVGAIGYFLTRDNEDENPYDYGGGQLTEE